jgi:hypothetical protein
MNGWLWSALVAFIIGLILASPYVASEAGRPEAREAFTLMLWGMLCLVGAVVLLAIGVFA